MEVVVVDRASEVEVREAEGGAVEVVVKDERETDPTSAMPPEATGNELSREGTPPPCTRTSALSPDDCDNNCTPPLKGEVESSQFGEADEEGDASDTPPSALVENDAEEVGEEESSRGEAGSARRFLAGERRVCSSSRSVSGEMNSSGIFPRLYSSCIRSSNSESSLHGMPPAIAMRILANASCTRLVRRTSRSVSGIRPNRAMSASLVAKRVQDSATMAYPGLVVPAEVARGDTRRTTKVVDEEEVRAPRRERLPGETGEAESSTVATEGEAVDVDVDEEDEEDDNVVSSPPCTTGDSEEEDPDDPTSPEEEAAGAGTELPPATPEVSGEASGCFATFFRAGKGGTEATSIGSQSNAATIATRKMARAIAGGRDGEGQKNDETTGRSEVVHVGKQACTAPISPEKGKFPVREGNVAVQGKVDYKWSGLRLTEGLPSERKDGWHGRKEREREMATE